jgi:hypothetical protein
MAERLATLPGLIPRPGWRPAISVKKVALICNPASGRRSQALQLRLYMGLKFAVAKAKVFPHLEAWVRVGQGILHLKHSLSLLMVQYSKDTHAIKKTLKKSIRDYLARELLICLLFLLSVYLNPNLNLIYFSFPFFQFTFTNTEWLESSFQKRECVKIIPSVKDSNR